MMMFYLSIRANGVSSNAKHPNHYQHGREVGPKFAEYQYLSEGSEMTPDEKKVLEEAEKERKRNELKRMIQEQATLRMIDESTAATLLMALERAYSDGGFLDAAERYSEKHRACRGAHAPRPASERDQECEVFDDEVRPNLQGLKENVQRMRRSSSTEEDAFLKRSLELQRVDENEDQAKGDEEDAVGQSSVDKSKTNERPAKRQKRQEPSQYGSGKQYARHDLNEESKMEFRKGQRKGRTQQQRIRPRNFPSSITHDSDTPTFHENVQPRKLAPAPPFEGPYPKPLKRDPSIRQHTQHHISLKKKQQQHQFPRHVQTDPQSQRKGRRQFDWSWKSFTDPA